MSTFGENYVNKQQNKAKWFTQKSGNWAKKISGVTKYDPTSGLAKPERYYTVSEDGSRKYSDDKDQKKWDRSQKWSNKANTIISDIDSGKALETGNQIGEERSEKWDKAKQIMSATAGGMATAMNAATTLATSQMDIAKDSSFHGAQQVGQALSAFGPYGALAGAALTGASALAEGLGIGTSQMSKSQAEAAGISGGQRMLNNIAGILAPGIGHAIGKTISSTAKTAETQAVSGAYADAIGDINAASSMGGKRYLFGSNNVNDLINEANRKNAILTEIGRTNTLRKQSDYGQDIAAQNQRIYAGTNYAQSAIGKHGLKLASIEEIQKILAMRKEEDVQSFHNGGVIGIDVNVIPEGKYHAHKNHLGDVSEEFEDLTKKGIPVIVHSEGGEIEQVAEIEKYELIFRLEVTQKLEELCKDGSEEAMIEAGKLVAYEIIENTQDNSGEVLKDE